VEFGLSKEQELLQASVRAFLDRAAPLERAQRYVREKQQRATDIWDGVCDLGLPGMLIAEEHGGLGLSLLDAALVAETLASRAAPVPLVATIGIVPLAIAAAGSAEQKSRWLPALAEGKVMAGAGLTETVSVRDGNGVRSSGGKLSGRASFVLDFAADVFLVADDHRALYLVAADASGLTKRSLTTIDETREVGELTFDGAAAEMLPGSSDPDVCARLLDAGRILLAADTLGAAGSMLEKAVAYSRQRVQFGRPIGSFQAVKHMCAQMAADLEPCRAMLWYAAYASDALPEESRLTACHTKAHLSEVGTSVAKTATEVHGGIGFTEELGLHLLFKRIGANRQLLGGPDRLREEAAALQGLVRS